MGTEGNEHAMQKPVDKAGHICTLPLAPPLSRKRPPPPCGSPQGGEGAYTCGSFAKERFSEVFGNNFVSMSEGGGVRTGDLHVNPSKESRR